LVQELVEVFNVVEVGGRPPVGGKAGTKGEWTIGDLILPVPGDIRRMSNFLSSCHTALNALAGYPPDHINAVVTHTIHFLSLLTFYLGIKLPFEIVWSSQRLGVGQPWIGAGKGTESGNWAKYVVSICSLPVDNSSTKHRWYSKHPLHLSSSGTSSGPSPSTQNPQVVSDSFIEVDSSQSSFTTAFAMLLYNVCYLAHTQSVDIPLSQAGDVLSNLWAVCCSPDLGR
jgi:hypothetical protein